MDGELRWKGPASLWLARGRMAEDDLGGVTGARNAAGCQARRTPGEGGGTTAGGRTAGARAGGRGLSLIHI
eukprot:10324216-Alexandrium_andersonii.AAC.1